ncbi:MAG: type 4a pilus biogenesis protein PilO, partial [Planctomycetes bacterium]|nr:type 4a pilus biogenesis protein PilO [Planctomycetota bacterium]
MSNTIKTLLAVGIGFLVVLVPGTLAFLDFLAIGEAEEKREAFDKQKADLQTKKNQLPGMEESAKGTIKDYFRRKKSLPTGDEVDAYVLTLGEYRNKCGIAVWELTPVKDTAQESPDLDAPLKFAYTIKMKAKFHEIGQLLALIENWDRFIQVNTLKVTGGGKPQEIEVEDKKWPDGKRKELDGNVDLEVELGL